MIHKKQGIALIGSVIAGLVVIGVAQLAVGGDSIQVEEKNLIEVSYTTEYAETLGKFSAKTASRLLSGKMENTCYSPTSMFGVMTLIAELTEGDTQTEMLGAMGIESVEDLESVYGELRKQVMKTDESGQSDIRMSTSVWLASQTFTEEAQTLIDDLETKLGADIFYGDEYSEEQVDNWITESTEGMVNDLSSLSINKEMSLVSSLYYNSAWSGFEEIGRRKFYTADGETVLAKYIEDSATMKFFKQEDYTAVAIPLTSGRMVFVLPDEDTGLNELLMEERLEEIMAVASGAGMEIGNVHIQLPVFDIGDVYEEELHTVMKAMGITQLFEDGQWILYDNMGELVLSIYQGTQIQVTRYGVKAAATTREDVLIVGGNAYKSLDIMFDRPFLYILENDKSPLFIGTVYNPNE